LVGGTCLGATNANLRGGAPLNVTARWRVMISDGLDSLLELLGSGVSQRRVCRSMCRIFAC
jgi:hypothetical protein